MDEKLLELVSSAGGPTTVVGGLLLLFFYLRKAEAGMRSEINGSLVRLQKEKSELQEVIDKLEMEATAKEITFDTLRKERRTAEDETHRSQLETQVYRQRAELAESKLRQNGIV